MPLVSFTDEELGWIKRAIAREKSLDVTTRERVHVFDDSEAPEVHLVKCESSIPGITPPVGTGTGPGSLGTPGSGECIVYRTLAGDVYKSSASHLTVYNAGLTIPADEWFVAARTKYGQWFAVQVPRESAAACRDSLPLAWDLPNGEPGVMTAYSQRIPGLVKAFDNIVVARGSSETLSGQVAPLIIGPFGSLDSDLPFAQDFYKCDPTAGPETLQPYTCISSTFTGDFLAPATGVVLTLGAWSPSHTAVFCLAQLFVGDDLTTPIFCLSGNPAPAFAVGSGTGKYGTDAVGNVFMGGICTTVGTGTLTLTVGTTAISGGAAFGVLYNNGGVLGNVAPSSPGQVLVSGSIGWVSIRGHAALAADGTLTLTRQAVDYLVSQVPWSLREDAGAEGAGAGSSIYAGDETSIHLAGATFSAVFGTAAGTVCQGNDSRLSDARTPSPHHTTHEAAGSDRIQNVLLDQTGLQLKGGTGIALTLKVNEILTASRTLSVITGDSDRTLTLAGDTSLSGNNTGDQTSVSGNAGTATKLQTARRINGVPFDGSADVWLPMPWLPSEADASDPLPYGAPPPPVLQGAGPPANFAQGSGAPGQVYFDVSDPNNPMMYVGS